MDVLPFHYDDPRPEVVGDLEEWRAADKFRFVSRLRAWTGRDADSTEDRGSGGGFRVESLAELREQRAFACRLTPDPALRSLDEADAFLADRGLLTRTPDCALPSLYGARPA
jgi:hypothetical protein